MRFQFRTFSYLLLCILSVSYDVAGAYKYLGILHPAAKSHFAVGSSLMRGLAAKGHEVYVVSPFPQKQPIENYHDIPIESVIKAMAQPLDNIFSQHGKSVYQSIFRIYDFGLMITDVVLNDTNVQALMASNHTFDAIICEVFFSEALYGLSEHFNAPLIGLGTFGAASMNTDMVGSPSPPSYVPHPFLTLTDHMTLTERVGNLAFLTFDKLMTEIYYLPKQSALYKKYFPHVQRDMYEVRKDAALVLLNSHVSLGLPRPYMPNQIEVGGMHIKRERKPLPADIEKFINGAEHGVVYFSMGSNLKSKDIPLEKRQAILDTFKKLKQRVLWKFEDIQLEGKPDNVFISDWFPQDDILAHDNVKVFITHGGLLSITESIYHGKPIIGIPIFGDQFLNMARAQANGYGIALEFANLNSKDMLAALNKVLSDKTYTERVRAMSARYKDQPMLPLDRAVYWAEHVVRHKGAKYLHCAGLDLNFIQYHNIDAMLILYGGILFVLYAIVYFFGLLAKSFLGKGKPKNKKKAE